ncbi:DUF3347 domain-containing protein [Chitinophaga silvatica]|uniref:DUF3347 domain-containing protein n=1 Tax=Chitinophaga silvatica TaxID=2282649 RepID=A0A3E1Y451_9BACT|nr:DUF3347 domain-containing protein [Chitinophaga silvatica]RFS19455.1 DUF3347 domain-containing protein [Chitinophaga silvatica]
MKKSLLISSIAGALTLIFLAACSSSITNTNDTPAVAKTAGNKSTTHVLLKDDKLNAVYQQYALLRDALTKGNIKEARFASNAIEAGAREIKDGESLITSASRITATANIEEQRITFSILSNDLLKLIKQSGIDKGELYVDYCPMALADKGAIWINHEKAIQNPYFGEKMMTCGEIRETIN